MKNNDVKLVHLIGGLGVGGAEKQLLTVVSALSRRGWNQSVIAFGCGGEWNNEFLRLRIPVYEIPQTSFKPLRLVQLVKLLNCERCSICISWSPHVAVYAVVASLIMKFKTIFNVRCDLTVDSDSGKPSRYWRLYKHALQKSDLVVTNSRWALDVLVRGGVSMKESAVIGNIVSVPSCGRLSCSSCPVVITAVGSLKPLKGYHLLIDAMRIVHSRGGKFLLQIVGDGPELERLRLQSQQAGISNMVRFCGYVDRPEALLSKSHVFVHTSASESRSNAILEAMAVGLPVIAFPNGGNSEIVEEGKTGFLVNPQTPQALAETIESFISAPNVGGEYGNAGRAFVESNCSETVVLNQYERIIESALR